ncbi:hypothetical protein ACROYT_G022805 [Oculina patagonica]
MQRVRTNTERRSRQLAKICMVVVLFFYMSWLPLVICITMQQVSVLDFTRMVFVASFLALSSPVANPCIYFLMWKRYRKAFMQLTVAIKWRNHSLRKKTLSYEPQENSQPRKDARPSSLTRMLPLSSPADDGRGSSPSFIFTGLHERCQATDAKVDLTQRKPSYRQRGRMKCTLKEEWNLHKLGNCEKNNVMHQLMATNNADLKYTRLETDNFGTATIFSSDDQRLSIDGVNCSITVVTDPHHLVHADLITWFDWYTSLVTLLAGKGAG